MGLFDSTATSVGIPWEPLRAPVLQGVGDIRSLLNQGPYQGVYTAPIDPYQLEALGLSADAARSTFGAGAGLVPGLQSAFDYYSNAVNGGANPWLNNQDAYLGLAGNVANNPYVDSMIQASLRDPYRQLTEQDIPGVMHGANLAGVAGGSAEGIARGIAERGYGDRAADISAGIRGQAYSQGLGIANDAAGADNLLQQNAANNLFSMGSAGLGFGAQGSADLFNTGTQNQGLQNKQIEAEMAKYYAPWELLKSYGSYVNPLAGSLKEETVSQDQLASYLFSALGPALGGIGGALGDKAGGWLFGNPDDPNDSGALGDLWGKIKDLLG